MSPERESSKDPPSVLVFFGDLRKMTSREIADGEVSLIVTSPPYYNAPFDYPDLFPTYDDYLDLIRSFAAQSKRVLGKGRICAIVTDDMLVKDDGGSRGRKYPLVADTTRIFLDEGFLYRDKITWVKPAGYTRISRRSGVVLQQPYPMYFYPDNIQESILIFQKGKFDYSYIQTLAKRRLEKSRVDVKEYNGQEWYLTVWNITNVLPFKGRAEEGIAAFPDEIPRRLLKLYSFAGETVLDPFAGSGTTLRVAKELGRNSWGFEVDLELMDTIRRKLETTNGNGKITFQQRKDARKLRSLIRESVKRRKSVALTHMA